MSNSKSSARLRRSKKLRASLKKLQKNRLIVHKSNKHIYAQIISPENVVVVAASSNSKEFKKTLSANGSNIIAAQEVGKSIAKKAIDAKLINVALDRSGYPYHGRVKALADAARQSGLEF